VIDRINRIERIVGQLIMTAGSPASFFGLSPGCLLTLFTQVFLKYDRIPSVALINCICKIANERHQADDEVNQYIHQHHHAQARWKAAIDFFAILHDHHGKASVCGITNAIRRSR
jgi:hypothetical protein